MRPTNAFSCLSGENSTWRLPTIERSPRKRIFCASGGQSALATKAPLIAALAVPHLSNRHPLTATDGSQTSRSERSLWTTLNMAKFLERKLFFPLQKLPSDCGLTGGLKICWLSFEQLNSSNRNLWKCFSLRSKSGSNPIWVGRRFAPSNERPPMEQCSMSVLTKPFLTLFSWMTQKRRCGHVGSAPAKLKSNESFI